MLDSHPTTRRRTPLQEGLALVMALKLLCLQQEEDHVPDLIARYATFTSLQHTEDKVNNHQAQLYTSTFVNYMTYICVLPKLCMFINFILI